MSQSVTIHQGNCQPISNGVLNVIPSGDNILNMDVIKWHEPPSAFIFSDGHGKQCSISIKNGTLQIASDFEMDESAQLFFSYFKEYVENYVKSVMPHDNLKYLEWCANEGRNVQR